MPPTDKAQEKLHAFEVGSRRPVAFIMLRHPSIRAGAIPTYWFRHRRHSRPMVWYRDRIVARLRGIGAARSHTRMNAIVPIVIMLAIVPFHPRFFFRAL